MTKKIYFSIIGLLSIFAFFGSYESWRKHDIIKQQQYELISINKKLELTKSERDTLYKKLLEINQIKFNRTFSTFKKYNPNVDTSTVETFIKVTEFYRLDSTRQMFDTFIAQLCYESSARHRTNGKVTESSGNALGISQIVPTTAFQYLRYNMDDKDREDLEKLGLFPVDWISEYKYDYKTKDNGKKIKYVGDKARKLIKQWLYSEKNNIALWGFIMKYTLEKNNYNINKSLLAYNQGGGFVAEYPKDSIRFHSYVHKVNLISQNIDV